MIRLERTRSVTHFVSALALALAGCGCLSSANAQIDSDTNAISSPTTTEATPKDDTPEPVFSLGPMPFLPPPSWQEDEDLVEEIPETVDAPAERATESETPTETPINGGAVFTLGPMPLLPPVSRKPEQETSVSDADAQTTTISTPAAIEDVPAAPTRFSQELTPDKEPPQPVPNIPEPAPFSSPPESLIPTHVEHADEDDLWDREPVMEQVDVTAKRLPPPSPVPNAKPVFSVSSAPPPGFEDLAGAQTTLVDVVFGNRVVISTMATFDMGMLEFTEPAEVLASIPNVTDTPAPELLASLTGPLDTHSDQLCYSDYDTECGKLNPQIAAVLFDEARFRATLFIHPDYLATNYLADSTYLPRSDSGAASVHAFSVSANGDSANQNLNLSANSLVSYRESRIESQYDVDSRDGLSIDTLTLKHDARGWEYEAGAFRSRIQSAAFLPEQNLVGARLSTSLNTRTDLRYAEATPLFAYLEQRSRVDILRGSQLLDSRFYEAGNQQLDTSRLPDGAYNITVRIDGNSSASQTTEYYFARTSALPPKDQPLYFAEAGELALTRQSILPELSGNLWLRAGTAHRLRDDFGLEAAISSIGDSTLFEGGVVWFRPGLQLQATLLAGDSTGVSIRSVYQHERLSLSADIRRINSREAVRVGDIELLPETYTQANVTASLPLFDGRLLAQGRLDRRATRDFSSFGFNYSREVRRFAQSNMSFNIDTTFSTDDSIVRLGVDWRWRGGRGRDASVQPRVQYSADTGRADGLINARYNKTLRDDADGTYRANAYIDRAVERSVIGARLSAEHARGVGDVEVQYGVDGERPGMAYTANARFGVVSSGSEVAVGGRRASTSSIIVDIDGNAPDAVFEVMVGKQSHGYAKSGSRTLISLPPYETYNIRLVSRDGEFVEFDESSRSVTLYPGNVKTLKFTASRQIVVVGKAVDEEGYVLAHHTFTDLDGFASTDENGWFQIEITNTRPLTLKRGEASICVIELPLEDESESLVVLDEVVCR